MAMAQRRRSTIGISYLEKAVSPDYLEDRGLKEGSHGEIVNERGRTIFEVGFAWAIRRVLGV
ncbi:gamma-mobile-trio protein GmtX [Aeromonas caviae]|uniref:gamma-mobile-trio protein GmtX n=1 Tax=Aeromonas caviae TaxID=648 RepID=UPI0038D22CFE